MFPVPLIFLVGSVGRYPQCHELRIVYLTQRICSCGSSDCLCYHPIGPRVATFITYRLIRRGSQLSANVRSLQHMDDRVSDLRAHIKSLRQWCAEFSDHFATMLPDLTLCIAVLLIHRLFSARRAKRFRLGQAMLRARMLTSLLLDSGLPGSLVLATILLVHTVAGTAASLVIENFVSRFYLKPNK